MLWMPQCCIYGHLDLQGQCGKFLCSHFLQFYWIWFAAPLWSSLFLPMVHIILLCVKWDVLHALRLISGLEAWSPTVTEFSLGGSSPGPLPAEQLHTNKVHLKQLGSAGAAELPKLQLICATFAWKSPEEEATNKCTSWFSCVWLVATKPQRFSTGTTAKTGRVN